MDINLDSYNSRPVRVARAIGILVSWAVWAVALLLAFTTAIPQVAVLLIMVLGFMPYILSIKLVEPWLVRRMARGSEDQDPKGHDPG